MKILKKLYPVYVKNKLTLLSHISGNLAGKEAFKIFCTPMSLKRARALPGVLSSGEALSFTTQGIQIHGFRFNGIRKQKVLILHGFSSSLESFHQYISMFAAADFEVLAFNAPAHGTSSGKRTNALQYSEMIVDVMKKYGPVANFVAHSFGGLAVTLALEKFAPPAQSKVVLIAPATETNTAIEVAFNFLKMNTPKIVSALQNEIEKVSGRPASWFSVSRAIQNIDAKFLWVHDVDDDVTPFADAEKVMKKEMSNVKFEITTSLGHRKIYRDKTVQKKILDFICSC